MTEVARVLSRIAPWLALLLGVAALWVWADRLLPRTGEAGLHVVAPEDCDLNLRACRVTLPSGGTLRLSIEPRPVVHLQPSSVEVELSDADPRWVEVDLAGVEMFMGYQRPRLERVGPGIYRGEAVLPACTGDRMTWAATVLPEGVPDRAEVQFRFVTRR